MKIIAKKQMRTRLLAALVAVGLLGVGPGISAASELPAPSAVPEGAAGLVVPSGEVREGATIQASTIDVRGTIQGVGGDLLLRATTVHVWKGGLIRGGDGADGETATALRAAGAPGGPGGHVVIEADRLVVDEGGFVLGGEGGRGGHAVGAFDAIGGAGGDGGSVVLRVRDVVAQGVLAGGAGGRGGSASASPRGEEPLALPTDLRFVALGGAGGDAGGVTLDGVPFSYAPAPGSLEGRPSTASNAAEEEEDPCNGLPSTGASPLPGDPDGGDGGDACADNQGIDGLVGPGPCTAGLPGQKPTNVTAKGGKGGDGATGTVAGDGGDGGSATAKGVGGKGGDGAPCPAGVGGVGGVGGWAIKVNATGGRGGDAGQDLTFVWFCSFGQDGGDGGDALSVAQGGDGGKGGDGGSPDASGDGGPGGVLGGAAQAEATGGDGGHGGFGKCTGGDGGEGGDATAASTGGNGGKGGDAIKPDELPQGAGGDGGKGGPACSKATAGEGGADGLSVATLLFGFTYAADGQETAIETPGMGGPGGAGDPVGKDGEGADACPDVLREVERLLDPALVSKLWYDLLGGPIKGALDDRLDPGWSREPNDFGDLYPGATHGPCFDQESTHRGYCNSYWGYGSGSHGWTDAQVHRVEDAQAYLPYPLDRAFDDVLDLPEAGSRSQASPYYHVRTLSPGAYEIRGHAGVWQDASHAVDESVFPAPPGSTVETYPMDGWVGRVSEGRDRSLGYHDTWCQTEKGWGPHTWAECNPYQDGNIQDPQSYGDASEFTGACGAVAGSWIVLNPLGGRWNVPVFVLKGYKSVGPPVIWDFTGANAPITLPLSCGGLSASEFRSDDLLILPQGNAGAWFTTVLATTIQGEAVTDVDTYQG